MFGNFEFPYCIVCCSDWRRADELHHEPQVLALKLPHKLMLARPINTITIHLKLLVKAHNHITLALGDHLPKLKHRVGHRVLGDDKLATKCFIALQLGCIDKGGAIEAR